MENINGRMTSPVQANVYLSGLKVIIDNQTAENRNLEKKIGELEQEKKVLHQTVVNLLNILDTVEKDLKKRGLKLIERDETINKIRKASYHALRGKNDGTANSTIVHGDGLSQSSFNVIKIEPNTNDISDKPQQNASQANYLPQNSKKSGSSMKGNIQESSDGSIRKFITKLGPGDLDKGRRKKRKISLVPGDMVAKGGSQINVVYMKESPNQNNSAFDTGSNSQKTYSFRPSTSKKSDANFQPKLKVVNLNESPKKNSMKENHMEELLEVIDSNKTPCDICHELFTCKKKFGIHYRIHTKHHKCKTCGKQLSNIDQLKYHQRTHRPRRKRFMNQCDLYK